ncbi:DUF4440 domain-containing protein [Rhodanobacter sp. L36]|uniref:nuclear transport factor 2 family protein n=1 Tax=Rhodanobacter sp. L36 TaxID=1747221 RepID=UPI00131C0495|nr:DUF4440 domain-containing protein [Rhodanobacter sp. L36]
MIRTSVLIALILASLNGSLFARAAPSATSTITESELLRRTQQLYDAANVGDSKPWDAYFASDAMVFDEKGRSMDKKSLLADTTPLPAGYAVHLTVVHPHVIVAPGAAMVGYECEETETVFGQSLHARYHTVDTWLYRQGRWQIAASQTMRYYEDPALGTTNVSAFDGMTGTYELSPGNQRSVLREGNDLFVQRGTGAKTKLLPESGDLFFRKGVEGRILFHRDAQGKVDALYDRRNNEDIVWKRVR